MSLWRVRLNLESNTAFSHLTDKFLHALQLYPLEPLTSRLLHGGHNLHACPLQLLAGCESGFPLFALGSFPLDKVKIAVFLASLPHAGIAWFLGQKKCAFVLFQIREATD